MGAVVSVLMSVFNGERFLRESIESVLNQTFQDFEFIVIDDGSTDDTANILANYEDSRLRCHRNRENLGLTRSLNKGLAISTGKYIARQDADDRSKQTRLEKQVARMESNPKLGLLGTFYDIIDANGEFLSAIEPPTDNAQLQEELLSHNQFSHGSVMFRRTALALSGDYRSLPIAQDYDMWLRIAEHFEIENLDEPLYEYRFHNEAISVNKLEQQSKLAHSARSAALARRGDRATESLTSARATQVELSSQLLRTTLWYTYLAFLAADVLATRQYAAQAYSIATRGELIPEMARGIAGHARVLSKRFADAEVGLDYIRVVCAWDDDYGLALRRELIGDYYFELAFQSLDSSDLPRLRHFLLAALRNKPSRLKNAGARSISVAAVLGIGPHRFLKEILRGQ